MRSRYSSALLALVMAALGACASATDVESRGRLVLAATEPEPLGYCPPELLAAARTAVAAARAASERGEPIAAEQHLSAAERFAEDARTKAATCGPVRETPRPGPLRDGPNGPSDPAAAPDGDQDGVPDPLDRCLDEREDRDGFVDHDGCPDVDDDGDGLSDVIDKCPRDPEDLDGFEDLDGCPEPGP